MADYRLEGWESRDIQETVGLVLSLLSRLPEPIGHGCFSAGFDEWETASHLSRLPHRARYSCCFSGDGIQLDTLDNKPPSSLGDVTVVSESTRVGIWKENDDDPSVASVKRMIKPIMDSIRPGVYKKVGLAKTED